jgi:phospholipid-translocating ATPase
MVECRAEELQVGDIALVQSGERVPADMVLLYTTDKAGTVFIKTDQLDGETDWKVRRPVQITQQGMEAPEDLIMMKAAEVRCEGPNKFIYEFSGVFANNDLNESLSLESTLWAETILASQGFILGLIIYTGR